MPDARSRPERPPAERAAARPGEPPPRRRSRHAPPLGGRGPRSRVHDARRAPAVRARDPGATSWPGARRHPRSASVGATTDRLRARTGGGYGEIHGDGGRAPAAIPEADRDAFRDRGRRLAEALVRYLDGPRPARNAAEAEAVDLAALLGERVRRQGIPLGGRRLDVRRGPPAVPRRAAAGRPPSGVNAVAVGAAVRHLDRAARPPAARVRRGATRARSWTTDDVLEANDEPRPVARADLDPGRRVRGDAARPVARAAPRVPAGVGVRDAVLRHRGRRRGGRGRRRLERGHLPRVVPDRARSGRPAGSGSARRSCWAGRGSATRTRLLLFGAFITFVIRNSPNYAGAGALPILYLFGGDHPVARDRRSRPTSSTRAGPGSRAAR